MSEAAAIASCVRNGEAPDRHDDGIRVQRLLFLQVYSPSIFGTRRFSRITQTSGLWGGDGGGVYQGGIVNLTLLKRG